MGITTTVVEGGVRVTFPIDLIPSGAALGIDPFQTGKDTHFIVGTEKGHSVFRDICPHLGETQLPWRKNAYLTSDGRIQCSIHGAIFDPISGICLSGPCQGDRIESFQTSINATKITVFLPCI